MGENREDFVYKAKLAEQAERYDGEWNTLTFDTGIGKPSTHLLIDGYMFTLSESYPD